MCHFEDMRAAVCLVGTSLCLISVLLMLLPIAGSSPSCQEFNGAVDGSYWDEVANCTACTAQPSCGFCLSTLQCMSGGSSGPSDGSPCPSWITDSETCPGICSILLFLPLGHFRCTARLCAWRLCFVIVWFCCFFHVPRARVLVDDSRPSLSRVYARWLQRLRAA